VTRFRAHQLAFIVAGLLSGCTAPEDDAELDCGPGETENDGKCIGPVEPVEDCPAGEVLVDGACLLAGVQPSGCGQGFVHDGWRACVPELPAEACPATTMAVPGDSSCHEVSPCGAAPWGDIPVDVGTVYVDGGVVGGDGSAGAPYSTIQQAVNAATSGAIVAIAAGTYAEAVTVSGKAVRLWGVCPAQVEIAGPSTDLATLTLMGAGASEVHHLSLSGGGDVALLASNALGLIVEGVRIHDTPQAIAVEESLGPTSLTLSDSLVESVYETIAFVGGSELVVERSLLRGPPPGVNGSLPEGVFVDFYPFASLRGRATLRQSVVEAVLNAGLMAFGSDATLEASVVRDVRLAPGEVEGGYGALAADSNGQRGNLVVQRSLIAGIPDTGIIMQSSDLVVEDSVLSDLATTTAEWGSGIYLGGGPEGRSVMRVERTLLMRAFGFGMVTYGSDAVVVASAVIDTRPGTSKNYGVGVMFDNDRDALLESVGELRDSYVEAARMIGVMVDGSTATLSGLHVLDTLPSEIDQPFSRGIQVQNDVQTEMPGYATVDGSLVENSFEFGIAIADANVVVTNTVVRGSRARMVDGLFGDGIAVVSHGSGMGVATLSLIDSMVLDSDRAGIGLFGSAASIRGTYLECNGIHLNGEPNGAGIFEIEDGGENVCACGGDVVSCQVLSSMLLPPAALP
jgi:hypothetical protein